MTCTIDFSPSVFPPETYESIPDDFIRIASYSMPNTTATEVSHQFSSFLTLKLLSKKQTIPLFNCKRGDVPRCGTCKAYLSPFVKVDKDHRCWRCPLCGHLNSTIMFTSLYDMTIAVDRPEIHSLVYDIQPPKEMLFINGKHRVFLFMIDEWLLSFKSTSYESLLKQLDDVEKVIRPTDLIGLIIYSSTVTLFDLRNLKSESYIEYDPTLYLKSKEFFVPASEGFENLKTSVRSFGHSKEFSQTVLYTSILWSCHLMRKIGGRLLIFSSGRNNYYGYETDSFETNEEVNTRADRNEKKVDIFNLLRNHSISVSLFKVGPLRQVEEWVTKTGGFLAPFGQTTSLLRLFVLETVWDSALSLRTSTNVQTVNVYGNGSTLNNGVYLFPVSMSDQSYIFELTTKETGVPRNFYFQFSIRYTDDEGLRKIRVINGMMPFTDVTRFPVDEASISLFLLRKRHNEGREKVFNSRVELTRQLIIPNAEIESQLPLLLYSGTIMDADFINNASVERFALAVFKTTFTFSMESEVHGEVKSEVRVIEVVWSNSMTIAFPEPTEMEKRVITDTALKLGMAPMNFFSPKDRPEFESMINNEREAKRWYSEVTGFIPK